MTLTGARDIARGAPHATSPKRLIMVAIDKGGVGKSYFIIQLIEWLKAQHKDFVAFDPDYCNSTLTRFQPESIFLDIRHSENLDSLVEVMDRTDTVIVDGVGSQQRIFLNWLEETGLLQIKSELNLRLTLVLIIEEDKDTVFQAGEAVRRVGREADWLVVRNLKMMQSTRIYDKSRTREDLKQCGAREITMAKLPESLVYYLQTNSMTIQKALDSNSLFLIDRQRLIAYRRQLYQQLDSAREILLP